MITESIIKFIEEDNLEEAFLVLKDFFSNSSDLQKKLSTIKGKHAQTKKDKLNGIIAHDDFNIAISTLRYNLIEMVTEIESVILSEPSQKNDAANNATNSLKKIAQDAVIDDGLIILLELNNDRSSVFFKAKKLDSHIENDFYVVQLLNQYQLVNKATSYNQDLLNFFSHCDPPFVRINEIYTGNPSYIIREYIKGTDLKRLLKRGIKSSFLQATDTIITIAKGLKAMHGSKEKIVYDNLIPSQIIMETNGHARILPMNIFDVSNDIVTWTQLKNAVKFMSPEQLKTAGVQDKTITLKPSSNQFSLGLIMFYLMTSESLYDGIGLPELYKDRLNEKETKEQLDKFSDLIYQQLLHYSLPKRKAKSLGKTFIETFKKLIAPNPKDRYDKMEDFIMEMELLKLQITKEKNTQEGEYLPVVHDSFERSLSANEKLIEDFYNKLFEFMPQNNSIKKEEYRNIDFIYSFRYLLTAISNLDNEDFLKEARSCLVQLHADFTIDDYESFFKIFKETISINDLDWFDETEKAWDVFIQKTLDSIDSIFSH